MLATLNRPLCTPSGSSMATRQRSGFFATSFHPSAWTQCLIALPRVSDTPTQFAISWSGSLSRTARILSMTISAVSFMGLSSLHIHGIHDHIVVIIIHLFSRKSLCSGLLDFFPLSTVDADVNIIGQHHKDTVTAALADHDAALSLLVPKLFHFGGIAVDSHTINPAHPVIAVSNDLMPISVDQLTGDMLDRDHSLDFCSPGGGPSIRLGLFVVPFGELPSHTEGNAHAKAGALPYVPRVLHDLMFVIHFCYLRAVFLFMYLI